MTPPNYTTGPLGGGGSGGGNSGTTGGSGSGGGNQISVYSLPRTTTNNVNLSVVSGPAPVSQRTDLYIKSANPQSQQYDVSRYVLSGASR